MTSIRWLGLLGLALVFGCDGGTQARSGSPRAGGETSEFGGSIEYCPEISSIALGLEDPMVAHWLALAQGRRELSLGWTPLFADTQGLSGSTSLSLAVEVVGARLVELGNSGGGYEGCTGSELELELEVQVVAGDGSVSGSFTNRVTTRRPEVTPERGGQLLTTFRPGSMGNQGSPLSGLSTSLDLGMGADALDGAELIAQLRFEQDSLRGTLAVVLPDSTTGGVVNCWSIECAVPGLYVLGGQFPDDGCAAFERRVDLDSLPVEYTETPRMLYESSRMSWKARTATGRWVEGASVELIFSGDAPSYACQTPSPLLSVHGSQRVEATDGSLMYDRRVVVTYLSNGLEWSVDAENPSLAIPVEDFQRATGIVGVDLDGASHVSINWSGPGDTGDFSVRKWQNLVQQDTESPVLTW